MSSTLEDTMESADGPIDEDATRAAFEDAARDDGRPLSQIAPETGIAYGTLSAWRNKTYGGRTERIARAVQAWLTSRLARARARATLPSQPQFVPTKTAMSIWERLEFAQAMPTIALITGDPGLGKTWALRAYHARYPETTWIATMEPCHSVMGAMLRTVMQALGLGAPQNASQMSLAIRRRLTGTRGLLMIDEAQHLTAESLDQLRTIYDLADVGVALVGSRQLLINMGMDRRRVQLAQIASRVGVPFKRERPTKADIGMVLDAWGVETEPERAELIAIALQPGGLRSLSMVLRIALGMAAAASSKLTIDHIRTASSQLVGGGA